MLKKENMPFLMKPAGKDYLWGGNRLNTEFGKGINMTPLAETWECSVHPDGPSAAVTGEFAGRTLKEILDAHPEFLGSRCKTHELPVLIKFIDAAKNLSVQVHPDDAYANANEKGQNGKNELWYVVDAAPGAGLIVGMKQDCRPEQVRRAAEDGTLEELLNRIPVKKGDAFFIPAGTVHAICAGALIAEIQQNSNLTYRLYDYNRVGADGKKRQLHIDKALDVADLKGRAAAAPDCTADSGSDVVSKNPYFSVTKLNREFGDFSVDGGSFKVLLCTDGSAKIGCGETELNIKAGDCVFCPADCGSMSLTGKFEMLVTELPD